jgi:hypothetical protein
MLMSRGEEFFDDNLDPTFTESDSTLAQHIDWVRTAFEEDLIDPESLQRDGVVDGQAMMAGTRPTPSTVRQVWLSGRTPTSPPRRATSR